MEIRFTAHAATATPVLWSFLRMGAYSHSDNNEVFKLYVPENATMIDFWDKFNNQDRDTICKNLSNLTKYKNIHQGLLALYRVADVVDGLCNCQFVNVIYNYNFTSPVNYGVIIMDEYVT